MSKNLPVAQYDTKAVDLLKKTYAKDLNETEFDLFIAQAKAMDLNPFTKEIYGIKVGGRLVLMTSIGGLRKIAHQSGRYLGCKVEVFNKSDGTIFSATATVKKLVGSHVAEFEATVIFDEYSSNQGNWKDMPRQMIAKTAEAHALRMAFPALEAAFEPAEVRSLEHADIEVDKIQEPEHETQEQPPAYGHSPADDIKGPVAPGAFMLKLAKNKFVAKRVDAHSKEELTEFVTWAYKQERLNPVAKEGVFHVEEYLKTML